MCPLMTNLRQVPDAARAIAAAALGRDPGPMAAAESSSRYVYVSPDVVVKIIDAGDHSRLDREIALVPHLPAGLTAPLLGSGLCRLGTCDVRYACPASRLLAGDVDHRAMPDWLERCRAETVGVA
jgi:hypothetical protein